MLYVCSLWSTYGSTPAKLLCIYCLGAEGTVNGGGGKHYVCSLWFIYCVTPANLSYVYCVGDEWTEDGGAEAADAGGGRGSIQGEAARRRGRGKTY